MAGGSNGIIRVINAGTEKIHKVFVLSLSISVVGLVCLISPIIAVEFVDFKNHDNALYCKKHMQLNIVRYQYLVEYEKE